MRIPGFHRYITERGYQLTADIQFVHLLATVEVSALYQYRLTAKPADCHGSLIHIVGRAYLYARQTFRLRDIRRKQCRKREHLIHKRPHSLLFHKGMSACRNHNRVNNYVVGLILSETPGNGFHNTCITKHSHLNGIHDDIVHYRTDLSFHRLCANWFNAIYALSILQCYSSYDRGGINAECRHRLDIRLYAGSATTVGTSYSKSSYISHFNSFSAKVVQFEDNTKQACLILYC